MSTTNAFRWLSLRVRVACGFAFVIGSLMPPYVPSAALAMPDAEVATQQFLLVEDGFLMKSSSLTRSGTRRAYAEGIIHTVNDGESLEKLATRYGITKDTIVWSNKLTPGSPIQPGQELLILPVDGVIHTVTRGQTLSRIASLYDVAPEVVAEQNRIEQGFIRTDQELIIPGGKPIISSPTVIATTDDPGVDADPTVKTPPKPDTPKTTATVAVAVPAARQNIQAEPTSGVLQKPCSANCFYTQYYNPGHYAVDMQERGGGPIFASEGGIVIRAETGWNGGYGNVLEVDHGNGLVTLYGHNKELYVKVGDSVTRGQMISWMGNTGRVYGQTGIHVHFEVILNGVKKNPLLYLE